MTFLPRVLLALALALACLPASADDVGIRNSVGSTVGVAVVTRADGSKAPIHVLADSNGVPYGPGYPLLTAPAILTVAFTDQSGAVITAGATILDIPASTYRKGGWLRAGPNNQGLITVTLKNATGQMHAETLEAGASLSLTVNGYVIQDEVLVSGSVAPDSFNGVTFQ